jgi:hypothetical protein
MGERAQLTEEECHCVVEVCLAEPNGWVPHNENLPLAERLARRGLVKRRMEHGEPVYRLTEEFKMAAALDAAIGDISLN